MRTTPFRRLCQGMGGGPTFRRVWNCRENLRNFFSQNIISRKNIAQNFPSRPDASRRKVEPMGGSNLNCPDGSF
jgi:hypothetical protein